MSCYKLPRQIRDQKVIIFDSPDGTGKTNIAQGLSMDLKIPYFRVPTQETQWVERSFVHSLRYGEPMMLNMIKQLKMDIILDRAYPAEWVYSQVYGRETDMKVLERVDEEFAKLGAHIVVPLRRSYDKVRHDHLVAKEMLPKLHDKYLEFVQWTMCSTVVIYVDDFKNDLKTEVELIKSGIEWGTDISHTTAATFSKEKREFGLGNSVRRGKCIMRTEDLTKLMTVLGDK